ncbi:MAG: thioesterase family protein [Candidatus Nanopelagicales bacterium]
MYSQTFQIRWDEVDPNQHMRHTVYLTYGAEARMAVFAENGIDFTTDGGIGIAPVLFREEAIYRREVPIGARIEVRTEVTKISDDGGRWSMRHEIFRPDGQLAATIDADGAWIDMLERKLAVPPEEIAALMRALVPTES